MIAPSQTTFDDAQLQIYTLMHRDSYPRFISSAQYKELIQATSVATAENDDGALDGTASGAGGANDSSATG